METTQISYERLRYLEGVEREAFRLITELKLRGDPPLLAVVEKKDHTDAHWALCTLFEAAGKLKKRGRRCHKT